MKGLMQEASRMLSGQNTVKEAEDRATLSHDIERLTEDIYRETGVRVTDYIDSAIRESKAIENYTDDIRDDPYGGEFAGLSPLELSQVFRTYGFMLRGMLDAEADEIEEQARDQGYL